MRCIAIAAVGALLCLSAPAKAELQVSISKSQQRLAVVIDGTEAYRWPVSTGRRGHATPSGSFHPTRLERHWYSRQYSMTPMPWSVFFHRGYAVHGTMEAYNLGHVASHGCVRLRTDNAAILYSLVRRYGVRHTKVTVMNGPLPGTPMADVGTPPPKVAAAKTDGHEELAAKAHTSFAAARNEDDDAGTRRAPRQARTVDYRISASDDEAQILRERAAWLRSLDRKYGITR